MGPFVHSQSELHTSKDLFVQSMSNVGPRKSMVNQNKKLSLITTVVVMDS